MRKVSMREFALQFCSIAIAYIQAHPEEETHSIQIDMRRLKEWYEGCNKELLTQDPNFLNAALGYENYCCEIVQRVAD